MWRSLRAKLHWSPIVLFVACALACGGVHQAFYTSRMQDLPNSVTVRDNFGPGEVPVIVLDGYNGQTVTIDVYRLTDGTRVYHKIDYVPREHLRRWHYLRDLPNDSYKANLSVSGNVVRSYRFNVAR